MSVEEQQKIKEKYYHEAIRYMDNAKESLQKEKKEDNYYQDIKYVKTACGIAYNGVLMALDCFLLLKGDEKPKGKARKSIEYYHDHIGKLDRKMLNKVNSVYEILHLLGYYDGIHDARVVSAGFENAYAIIEKIKP
jgi:hypothetical protein